MVLILALFIILASFIDCLYVRSKCLCEWHLHRQLLVHTGHILDFFLVSKCPLINVLKPNKLYSLRKDCYKYWIVYGCNLWSKLISKYLFEDTRLLVWNITKHISIKHYIHRSKQPFYPLLLNWNNSFSILKCCTRDSVL